MSARPGIHREHHAVTEDEHLDDPPDSEVEEPTEPEPADEPEVEGAPA